MIYDGGNVDYSTIENLKHAKICKNLSDLDGDTTIIAAAKKARISKILHVDTLYEYSSFITIYGQKQCVTVYGE